MQCTHFISFCQQSVSFFPLSTPLHHSWESACCFFPYMAVVLHCTPTCCAALHTDISVKCARSTDNIENMCTLFILPRPGHLFKTRFSKYSPFIDVYPYEWGMSIIHCFCLPLQSVPSPLLKIKPSISMGHCFIYTAGKATSPMFHRYCEYSQDNSIKSRLWYNVSVPIPQTKLASESEHWVMLKLGCTPSITLRCVLSWAWFGILNTDTVLALLHCTALHCTTLHCTALHCTALHCTRLHKTAQNTVNYQHTVYCFPTGHFTKLTVVFPLSWWWSLLVAGTGWIL